MGDHDRLLDDDPGRDEHMGRRREGGVQVGEHVWPVVREQVDEIGAGPHVVLGTGELGSVRARLEGAEVELFDAAVTPDLCVGGRQLGRAPLLVKGVHQAAILLRA